MAYFSNKTMKEFKDSMEANTSVLRELTIYVNQLREGMKNE
jgi:ribosomal protein S6